jgi:hypothetical protein
VTAWSLAPAFEWLQQTYLGETIRHSAAIIATLEIAHLIGLTLLLGAIVMVDLALLGHGIAGYPVSRIARQLNRWTVAGLAVMFASGPFLLISEAERCYKTPMFWIKMALLAMALVFHFTVHRRVTLAEPPVEGRAAKLTGALSLTLWFAVALAAKGIAIFQPA